MPRPRWNYLGVSGCTLRQYCDARIPAGLGTKVDRAIVEALGGYDVVVTFPAELKPTSKVLSRVP
jgi:hypothetical protein